MDKPKPPTAVEIVAGSIPTESALALIAALSGNPIGALLPILSKSLASARQQERVQAALIDINNHLESHEQKLRDLSDGQYKLINEAILAFLQTTSSEKLRYLQHAVWNSFDMPDIHSKEAIFLSRVIRDISAEEADFLFRNYSSQKIQLGLAQGDIPKDVLVIKSGGPDEVIVSGLISLGLIISAGPTFDDSGLMRFSNVVAKLLVLLQKPND